MSVQAPVIPKIQTTTEYHGFKLMAGNRPIDLNHVRELKREMQVNPHLFASNPISVNEHMYIIDGQHRQRAAQELGIPVYYVVTHGISLEDTRTLNVTQRRWKLMDFARSFADSGRDDYVTFVRLHNQYPNIAPSVLRSYLVSSCGSNIELDFRRGDFAIDDLQIATTYVEQLDLIIRKTKLKINGPMANAFLQLFKNPEKFDYNLFMSKLENEHARDVLRPQSSLRSCLRSIEETYNFQSKSLKRLF